MENTERSHWVDVSKAFAIIAIYFGHWISPSNRVELFAYSFHLELFFCVSGFFALRQQEKAPKDFLVHQFKKLIIPLAFFGFLSIAYFNINSNCGLNEMVRQFAQMFWKFEGTASPELWFLPALFTNSIVFYFLYKLCKRMYVILPIAYALFILFKVNPDFIGKITPPIFGISSVPAFLLFYALGAAAYPIVQKYKIKLDLSDDKKLAYLGCKTVQIGCILFMWLIYACNINNIVEYMLHVPFIGNMTQSGFGYANIRLLLTLAIFLGVVSLSFVFEKSMFLRDIGENTLILMGIEFIIKDLLTMNFIPIWNIGIVSLNSEVQVLLYSFITLLCVKYLFFKPLNRYVPRLIGK